MQIALFLRGIQVAMFYEKPSSPHYYYFNLLLYQNLMTLCLMDIAKTGPSPDSPTPIHFHWKLACWPSPGTFTTDIKSDGSRRKAFSLCTSSSSCYPFAFAKSQVLNSRAEPLSMAFQGQREEALPHFRVEHHLAAAYQKHPCHRWMKPLLAFDSLSLFPLSEVVWSMCVDEKRQHRSHQHRCVPLAIYCSVN